MKKIYLVFYALIIMLILSACNDFLEYEAYSPPTSADFWKTNEDINSAVDGLSFWQAREGIDGRGFMWFENCSDNMVTGRPQTQGDAIKNFAMTPDNGRDAKDNWAIMYQLVAKANDILRNVPIAANISDNVKKNAIAQAHFYRAFAYLWLSPWYGDNGPNGGIPILTEKIPVEELDKERPKSVLENYDLIIDDLRKAGDMLPLLSQWEASQWGRPHKAAAWGFAARAALYAAQYQRT